MRFEQLQWIADNQVIFIANNRPSKEQKETTYEIYNEITGENKKPNGCGRCWANVKKRVWNSFERNTNIF